MNYDDSKKPPVIPSVPSADEKGDATGGVIPYKNPHALAAYYFGVFSVIPIFGLISGSIAVPLGISGLRERKKRPIVRGAIHAWFGIVVGGLSVAVHLTLITMAIVAIATGK